MARDRLLIRTTIKFDKVRAIPIAIAIAQFDDHLRPWSARTGSDR